MLTVKAYKIGNTIVVAIPSDIVKLKNIDKNTIFEVKLDKSDDNLIIFKKMSNIKIGV